MQLYSHHLIQSILKSRCQDHPGHDRRGIEEVRRIWGDKAAEGAKIHLRRDESFESSS